MHAGSFGRNVIRILKSSTFQSWLIKRGNCAAENIFIIGRDSVKVLPGQTQSHRRIPGRADGIFLTQRVSVLIQRDFFVYVLKLIDVAEFFFPFAFSIKKPILDAGVTQFEPLGEAVVI